MAENTTQKARLGQSPYVDSDNIREKMQVLLTGLCRIWHHQPMKDYKRFSNRYKGCVYTFRLEVYLWEILVKYFDGDEKKARRYLRLRVQHAVDTERTLTAAIREDITKRIARELFGENE